MRVHRESVFESDSDGERVVFAHSARRPCSLLSAHPSVTSLRADAQRYSVHPAPPPPCVCVSHTGHEQHSLCHNRTPTETTGIRRLLFRRQLFIPSRVRFCTHVTFSCTLNTEIGHGHAYTGTVYVVCNVYEAFGTRSLAAVHIIAVHGLGTE